MVHDQRLASSASNTSLQPASPRRGVFFALSPVMPVGDRLERPIPIPFERIGAPFLAIARLSGSFTSASRMMRASWMSLWVMPMSVTETFF